MIVGVVLAFFGSLPLGYSGSLTVSSTGEVLTDDSVVQLFGMSTPSTASINDALAHCLPAIAVVGVGIFIIGSIWVVRRAGMDQVFGKYAKQILIASAALFLVSGLLASLWAADSSVSGAQAYAQRAQFVGMTLAALGILLVFPQLPAIGPSKGRAGGALVALGSAMLVIFTASAFVGEILIQIDAFTWDVLTLLYLSSVPLVFIGMLWVERGVEEGASLNLGVGLRAAGLISMCVLLVGAMSTTLISGLVGNGVVVEPALTSMLLYCYVLGLLLLVGSLMASGVKMLERGSGKAGAPSLG
jgi:hypothetical protein